MDSVLYKIGINTQTDKMYHHGYHRFYASILKKDIKQMLEIGIYAGSSLKMWLEYLPECYIWGIDINKEQKGDKFTILKCDQSNINELNESVSKIGENNLELIIDDGSHIPEHQILTFSVFFEKLLKSGGIYIIEDIETSYWTKNSLYGYNTNYGINHNKNIINIFSKILHLINSEFLKKDDKLSLMNDINLNDTVIDGISSITFGHNCVIIKKKEEYEYNYNNREYRFQHNL